MRAIRYIAVLLLLLTGCTVPQVHQVAEALGVHLTDQQAQNVANHYNKPKDCNGAIHEIWPSDLWAWAERTVWRESRNTPTARNRSGASGCFQLMLPLHADLFEAVGCSMGAWSDAWCNTAAAWELYQGAHKVPWTSPS